MTNYILTLSYSDRAGIVHAISGFLFEQGSNIEEAQQFSDLQTNRFFMRIRFSCERVPHDDLDTLLMAFAAEHGMQITLHAANQAMRTVLMVSKEGHCLNDLLFRVKSGLLNLDVRAIISNHREFYQIGRAHV